jgi:Tol biopolymer transport system component
MTAFDRIEPRLSELLDDLAAAAIPDYVDDLLRVTEHAPQRGAWSTIERWLPVDILAQRSTVSRVPWGSVVLVAVLTTVLIAAGLLISAGSSSAIPPPFGPAANGALLYRDTDGTIRSLDARTGEVSLIAALGVGTSDPFPSRDGRRLALLPAEPGPGRITVVAIDGSNAITLAGEYWNVSGIDWSPDSQALAIVSDVRGIPSISVLPASGSAGRKLSLGREPDQLWYLPDGRLVLLAAREPGDACNLETPFSIRRCDLFSVNPDGANLTPILDPRSFWRGTADAPRFDGIKIHPSPDGTKLVYVFWAENAEGRLHVVDIASGRDDRLPLSGVDDDFSINRAWFSPDGSAILFDLLESGGDHWAIVPSDGGQVREIGPTWPDRSEGTVPDAFWSPDGRSVLALYPATDGSSELWLLDATDEGLDRRLDVDVPYLPNWQRTGD